MTIVILNKLLKFRTLAQKALSFIEDSSKIFAFSKIDSIRKLQTIKIINIILVDEETAYDNRDFLKQCSNDIVKPAHIIILHFNKTINKEKFLKLFENTSFVYITPNLDYTNELYVAELTNKLKPIIQDAGLNVNKQKVSVQPPLKKKTKPTNSNGYKAILIGVSTGGPKALRHLLPELINVTNLPILIVQHILKTYTDALVMSLISICGTNIVKAADNQLITNNKVYIAPGGIHMTVSGKNSSGDNYIKLVDSPPEESVKPSVNYLFRSAAEVYGKNALAIILTGMGRDGTEGAEKLSRSGAHIIAQDEKSSTVWSMPKNAIEMGCVNEILPLQRISERIANILKKD